MRIADLISRLERRPDVVVDATSSRRRFDRYVPHELGAEVVSLDAPEDPWDDVPDEAQVVVLVSVVDEEDVAETVKLVAAQAAAHAGPVTIVLLLAVDAIQLPLPLLLELRDRHDFEVTEVVTLSYEVARIGVVFGTGRSGSGARLRSQLRLERFASGVIEGRARAAERRIELADELIAEVERQTERIEALTARSVELERENRSLAARVDGAERTAATAGRELAIARKRVRDIERSTSYRIGHLLVRIVKDPRLLRRVPAALLRRVRR